VKFLIPLLLISSSVQADAYIDLAIEYHDKSKDSFYQRNGEQIQNAIGVVEIGYEIDKYNLYFRHQSSVQQKDTGLNSVGIKVRIW